MHIITNGMELESVSEVCGSKNKISKDIQLVLMGLRKG